MDHADFIFSIRVSGEPNLRSKLLITKSEEEIDDQIAKIDILHVDLLAECFLHLSSFKDMAMASRVCRKWGQAMKHALAYRSKLSFAGCRIDNASLATLVDQAVSLSELDISAGRWGCCISDAELQRISCSKCCPNLTSISLWGVTGITDDGVVKLICSAASLEHLNIGGTFITDVTMFAIAKHCKRLKKLNLWGCKHVTERGLLSLSKGCPTLQFINIWGMKSSVNRERLLATNPHLLLTP